jgi:hypothetical protein
MVLRLPESQKIQTAVSFDWIAIVGICVVVVYISYPPLRELYFAPDSIADALPPGFDITGLHYFSGENGIVNLVEWKATNLPEGSQSAILWKFDDHGKISEERWFVDTEQWKAAF